MDQINIVDLLAHPSPQVRVAAVSSLTQVNDIMLLKLISQSYDDETDPQVRAAYEERISLVKERAS
jgi:HEAT repeat protein